MADKRNKALPEETIERKLTSFNNSQESVQATSAWIMTNKMHHQKIVDTWLKVLKNSQTKHKLTLFYLCNDVVQHAKRKKALYYLENFKDNLREAVHLVRDLNSIKPNIGRIFKIWEERRTYDTKFLAELRRILENESGGSPSVNSSASVTPMSPVETPPTPVKRKSESSRKRNKTDVSHKHREHSQKQVTETVQEAVEEEEEEDSSNIHIKFKPTKFVDQMTALRKLETEVGQKTKQLTTLRIDATNIEAVRQLKDRSHGQEFCKHFEESCLKIEDYVAMLEKEIGHRKQVVAMCGDAETFYDEQFKEAKIVANAYKNFGARISNMKKRVDDMKKIIPATPSPVPSPAADAPSPGNTPPLQEMDDNDTVDMEICEEDAESKLNKEQMAEPGRAYTAMVKSVTQPISSLTNITVGSETDQAPYKPESPVRSPSPSSTFQGSNILESRIATMLPNLAKGNSNIGLQGPEPPKIIEDYVPPKPFRQEPVAKQESVPEQEVEPTDDRSSTPVLDEQEDKTPGPVKTPPISKPAATKIKTNPIDFLSQLLTKSSNTSSSSNFLHSLSLLTNTVKSHYQKKQEEERSKLSEPLVSGALTEPVTTFSAVPPPEPTTQTSTWPAWKTVTTPAQPPLPQQPEPLSPPVLPAPPQAPPPDLPPLPQHQPPPPEPSPQAPLPSQPYPGQPPSPQGFPPQPFPPPNPPTPVSPPGYMPRGSVSQPYRPIPPGGGLSVNSQTFSAQSVTTTPSTGGSGFQPRFPFGITPNGDPSLPSVQPPLPSDPVSPHVIRGGFAPPPPPPPPDNAPAVSWQNDHPSQPGSNTNFGNQISAVSSVRSSWNRSSSWEQEGRDEGGGSTGYAHPWDQPHDYDDDEEEEETDRIEELPPNPLPPAPKSILRNRSSSLREVTLVDENDSAGKQNFSTHHSGATSDLKPIGILRKPPVDRPLDPIADVQMEFIAKLKQKSGGASAAPPPPSNRNLTTISTLESVDPMDMAPVTSGPGVHQGEPISTIGVLHGTGRASSIKSDDMDIDEEEDNVSNGNDWQGSDSEMWQEERQGMISSSSTFERPAQGQTNMPLLPNPQSPEPVMGTLQHQRPPLLQQPQQQQQRPPLLQQPQQQQQPGGPRPQFAGYNPYSPAGFQSRPQYFGGGGPAKRPFFPRQQRMPYYRY